MTAVPQTAKQTKNAVPAPAPVPAPASPAEKPAPRKRAYLSQAYIDSLVNRGFYELTEGATMADIGNRQQESIDRAKALGARLLDVAKGDPNEKYIQWRVGELYAQVAMEEQEILDRKARERQIVSNYLVQTFNAEVGKRRPDFAQLCSQLEQLEVVDPLKANDMEASIHDRSRGLSREIMAGVERLLSSGDLDKARQELDYCDANLRYLRISVAAYAQLSAKLRSRMDARRERTIIAEQLKHAEAMLSRDSLESAARAATDAQSRCTAIRQEMSPQEYERTAGRCDRMLAALANREMELVQANLEILRSQGIDAAIAFFDSDLKSHGMSRPRTTLVNRAIIEALVRQREEAVQTVTVSPELASLVNDKTDPNLSVEAMTSAAKKRAQARADSIRTAEEKKLSWRERRARQRRQKAAEQNRVATASPTRYASSPIASSQPAPRDDPPPPPQVSTPEMSVDPVAEQQAKERVISIYLLLEQNNVSEAQSAFSRFRAELRANLVPEAFETLRYAVEQAMTTSQRR